MPVMLHGALRVILDMQKHVPPEGRALARPISI